jgi:hypothetical protein
MVNCVMSSCYESSKLSIFKQQTCSVLHLLFHHFVHQWLIINIVIVLIVRINFQASCILMIIFLKFQYCSRICFASFALLFSYKYVNRNK